MSDKVRRILTELRRRLEELYGDRLVRIVLFGSQARGDAREDSDIDVAVVLAGEVDPNIEIDRVIPITSELSLENDVLISCIYLSAARYESDKGFLYSDLRTEGVTV